MKRRKEKRKRGGEDRKVGREESMDGGKGENVEIKKENGRKGEHGVERT